MIVLYIELIRWGMQGQSERLWVIMLDWPLETSSDLVRTEFDANFFGIF